MSRRREPNAGPGGEAGRHGQRKRVVVRVYCDDGHSSRTVGRFEPDPTASGWWRPVIKHPSQDRDDALRDTASMSPFGQWGDTMMAWKLGVPSVNDLPRTQQFLTGDRPGGETEEEVRAGAIPTQRQRFDLRCLVCGLTVPMRQQRLNILMAGLVTNEVLQVRLRDLAVL